MGWPKGVNGGGVGGADEKVQERAGECGGGWDKDERIKFGKLQRGFI